MSQISTSTRRLMRKVRLSQLKVGLILSRACLTRVVRDSIQQISSSKLFRTQAAALQVVHVALETQLVDLLSSAGTVMVCYGRVTLKKKDIWKAIAMRGN